MHPSVCQGNVKELSKTSHIGKNEGSQSEQVGRREVWCLDGQLSGGSSVHNENHYGAIHHRTHVLISAGLTDVSIPVLQTEHAGRREKSVPGLQAFGRSPAHS